MYPYIIFVIFVLFCEHYISFHRDCIHVLISAMSLRWKGMEGGQVYMVNLYLAKPSPVRRRQGSNWCIGLTTSQWIIIWWADADGFETVSIFRVERTDVGSCFDSCQWIYIWPVTWSDICRLIGMNPGNNRDWLQVVGNCLVVSGLHACGLSVSIVFGMTAVMFALLNVV